MKKQALDRVADYVNFRENHEDSREEDNEDRRTEEFNF